MPVTQNALTRKRTGKSYDYVGNATETEVNGNVVANPKARSSDRVQYHGAPTGGRNALGSTDYLSPDQNIPEEEQRSIIATLTAAGASRAPSALRAPLAPPHVDRNDKDDVLEWQTHAARVENGNARAQHARLLSALAARQTRAAHPWRLANAGVIGLLGFGMTTVLLNLVNTGHYSLMSAVPAIGICFGGGAQLIAGILEFIKGNTFGYAAFTSYGAFWLSLVCIWMLPNMNTQVGNIVAPASDYMVGVFMLIWAIYSFLMMLCTLRMNVTIFLLFLTLVLLFLLLAGGNMAGNATAVKAAGYEGIVCGSVALYLAFAEILNEVWDRTLLPIGPFADIMALICGKKTGSSSSGGAMADPHSSDNSPDNESYVGKHADNSSNTSANANV